MRLTSGAVHHRLSTSALVAALVVLGLYGLWRLPVDFLPGITYPMIKVHIWWSGATPEEIDKSLAEPIERQMATVDDLDMLESSSIEGMYTLLVNFQYGVDVNVAYQDALAAMARVARELPPDIDPPIVIKADPSQLPVAQVTVRSDRHDLVALRDWADNWLQDQLMAVPGVAGIEIVGGLEREIRVLLDPAALEKYRISLDTVVRRLAEENVEQFAGRVTVGPRELLARTTGEFRDLDDIRAILLVRDGPHKVTLRDVAEVVDAHEEARVITRLAGAPCVKLSVLKQASANTVAVSEAVNSRLADLVPVLPPGVRLGLVENQAEYVQSALDGVRNAAVQAALLLILVVYLFLGSFRQVLVMVVALPLTLVLTFGLMKLAGFSLNIFSLGGLVIAIGVVLDNSIVVLETVSRRRRDRPAEDAAAHAIGGTAEVGPAIVAATLSFLALFVPFLIVPGLTSLLFRELILVIAGIVVVSLGVAITVTPSLTAALFGRGAVRGPSRFERLFARVIEGYGRLLTHVLRLRWFVVAGFVVVAVVAAILLGRLGAEFLPGMDDGRVMVKVKLPTGASLAETDALLRRVEEHVAGDERIESAFTLAGGKVWGLYTYEIANEGEVDIQLVPRAERTITTREYIAELRAALAGVKVPGGKVMIRQMKVKGIRQLGQSDIEVRVRGQDVRILFDLAGRAATALNALPRTTNVDVSLDLSRPELQVDVDRVRAGELGVSVADVARTLRALVTGVVATQYRDRDEYYPIRAIVPEERLASIQDVEELLLTTPEGDPVRLRELATVRRAVGPVEIVREDQVKQVVVRVDAAGVSVGEALEDVRAAMDGVERPPGYDVSYGGQAQMMAEMKTNVLMVFAFAVFFAFVVLAVQFDSLKLPALILLSVPFCLAGVVLLLGATGQPLGATVLIGVLVVVAAAVNDGVLLLTFARGRQGEGGLTPSAAVIEAATIRLRPRVMTTLTTMVGFLPLALNLEEGGDMLQPMATAAIGGLALELLVAAFLMPCLYVLFTPASGAARPPVPNPLTE